MEKLKTKTVIKILEADGWYFVRQKGSHRQYKHPTKKGTVTINGKMNETQDQELLISILLTNKSYFFFKNKNFNRLLSRVLMKNILIFTFLFSKENTL